jgi:hypothetical protein
MPALVPLWAIGFLDQVWWSRFALPRLHGWQSNDHRVRLIEQVWQQGDPDPKALACSRVLWQEGTPDEPDRSQMGVREVSGRPESRITIPFLHWCCERLSQQGKRHWLLIGDNARLSWLENGTHRDQRTERAGQAVGHRRSHPALLFAHQKSLVESSRATVGSWQTSCRRT